MSHARSNLWRRTNRLLLLLAMLLALPAAPVLAAPPAQFGGSDAAADGVTTLLLGQYGFREMAAGDTATYELSIPEDGLYFVTAVDEAATDFDLVLLDADGNEIYNDVFDTAEVELAAGPITLQFTAVNDNVLSFVVVGQIGTMSAAEDQPGKLLNGSVYIEEDISEARYATISIPTTIYPQQVLIYVEPGEQDTFYLSAEGEDTFNSITTDSDNLLRFWTQGGDVQLYAEPYERRSSLTLIVFLSGRPIPLPLDTEVEGTIPVDGTEAVYELEVDATYSNLIIELDGDIPLNLSLVDHIVNTEVSYYSYGEPELFVDSLYPGVYYLFVESDEPVVEEVEFTLYASGERGRPLGVLNDGETLSDSFDAGEETILYAFDVDTPGTLVEVTLSGDEETDFDLYGGIRPGVNLWTNYIYGSDETLSFMAPVAGTYYIGVYSNDYTGSFDITATAVGPTPELETDILTAGYADARSKSIYRLELTEPNQLMTVILVGSSDVDLDLEVTGYDIAGDTILSLGSYSAGSAEIVSGKVPEPGTYEVVVSAEYTDEGSPFFIEARVIDPPRFGAQWAVDAVASSQNGDVDYSALQATGFNDTTWGADLPTAWVSLEPDAGIETLELTYAYPVVPHAVAIYETYTPGAVIGIEVYDSANDAWVTVWEGEAAATEDLARIFEPALAPVDFRTDTVRLTLDTAAVSGWNEIDAVQLFGRP